MLDPHLLNTTIHLINYKHDCFLSSGWFHVWGDTEPDAKSKWIISPVSDQKGLYRLQSVHDGRFLKRGGTGTAELNHKPSSKTLWAITKTHNWTDENPTYHLQNYNQYLACEKNGWVFANRDEPGTWESWTLTITPPSRKLTGPSGRMHLFLAVGGGVFGAGAAAAVTAAVVLTGGAAGPALIAGGAAIMPNAGVTATTVTAATTATAAATTTVATTAAVATTTTATATTTAVVATTASTTSATTVTAGTGAAAGSTITTTGILTVGGVFAATKGALVAIPEVLKGVKEIIDHCEEIKKAAEKLRRKSDVEMKERGPQDSQPSQQPQQTEQSLQPQQPQQVQPEQKQQSHQPLTIIHNHFHCLHPSK